MNNTVGIELLLLVCAGLGLLLQRLYTQRDMLKQRLDLQERLLQALPEDLLTAERRMQPQKDETEFRRQGHSQTEFGNEKRLSLEELQLALASWRDEDARWRAVQQILGEEIGNAMDRTCDKRTADHPGAMAHAAGGLSWLLDFRDRLVSERNRAMRVPEKKEAA